METLKKFEIWAKGKSGFFWLVIILLLLMLTGNLSITVTFGNSFSL